MKICGVRTLEDVQAVVRAGGDAVGLNFYPPSRRFLPIELAEALVPTIPAGVCRVGLFVNESAAEIRRQYERLRLNAVQLHGDETPEFVQQLLEIPVIKAWRLTPGEEQAPLAFLAACEQLGWSPRMLLLDAAVEGAYGGTGERADWSAAATVVRECPVPVILAGGLVPGNVAEAIRAVAPAGVDTASGVERDGMKSPVKIQEFIYQARQALGLTTIGGA